MATPLQKGNPIRLIEARKSLHIQTSVRLIVGGRMNEEVPTNKEVSQGCCISLTHARAHACICIYAVCMCVRVYLSK